MFVGTKASYTRLHDKLNAHQGRAVLVGRMSLADGAEEQLAHAATAALRELVSDLNVHRVVVEPSEETPELTLDFVREAKATGVRVSLLPRILEVVGSSIEVDDLDGLTLLAVRRFGLTRSSQITKRVFDICGAVPGLIAISPIIITIAMLIKLDSRGPVFFRQVRVGREGKKFRMWKFRTMIVGADEQKHELAALNEADGLFKIADDPRITRVGSILRKYCLDELPQLFNVLCGEMSLVGPRPLILDEDARITGLDRRRLHLLPGMTGHWQILGSRPHPTHRNGQTRLPLRRRLVTMVRRQNPRTHRAIRHRTTRNVDRPADRHAPADRARARAPKPSRRHPRVPHRPSRHGRHGRPLPGGRPDAHVRRPHVDQRGQARDAAQRSRSCARSSTVARSSTPTARASSGRRACSATRSPSGSPASTSCTSCSRRPSSEGHSVYILGARQEVLQQAVDRLRAKHPALRFAGWRDGYFSPAEEPAVAQEIQASGADLLFVAMSSPRKEYFLGRYGEMMGVPFVMGVGGAIDVVSGVTRRAPQIWQKLGLEWLFRLLQEPKRMLGRYARTNARFLMMLSRELLVRRLPGPARKRLQRGRRTS